MSRSSSYLTRLLFFPITKHKNILKVFFATEKCIHTHCIYQFIVFFVFQSHPSACTYFSSNSHQPQCASMPLIFFSGFCHWSLLSSIGCRSIFAYTIFSHFNIEFSSSLFKTTRTLWFLLAWMFVLQDSFRGQERCGSVTTTV